MTLIRHGNYLFRPKDIYAVEKVQIGSDVYRVDVLVTCVAFAIMGPRGTEAEAERQVEAIGKVWADNA